CSWVAPSAGSILSSFSGRSAIQLTIILEAGSPAAKVRQEPEGRGSRQVETDPTTLWPLLLATPTIPDCTPRGSPCIVNGARGRSYLMVSRHVCCRRPDRQVPRAGG